MQKLLFLLLAVGLCQGAFGQKNTKKAEKYLQKGETLFAQQAILKAISSESEQKSSRTWYVYGNVLKELSKKEMAKNPEKGKKLLGQALKGWRQASKLADEKDNYHILSNMEIQNVWMDAMTKGAEAFGKRKINEAISHFELMQQAKPDDTTGYIYQVSAALEITDYQSVKETYDKLIDLGYQNRNMYSNLIYIESYVNKDAQKAIGYCEQGMRAFPADRNLQKQHIDLLRELGRLEEAIQEAETLIVLEPQNEVLRLFIGMMADQLGQKNKAESYYKAVLRINNENFDANYNLATLYYTKGKDAFVERNDMLDAGGSREAELEKKGKKFMQMSLPYFKKAARLKPDYMEAYLGLRGAYTTLGMEDKVVEVNKKIRELRE